MGRQLRPERGHTPSYSLLGTYAWRKGHTDMLWPFHPESRARPVESEIQSFAFAMERKHPKNMKAKGDPQRDCRPGLPLRGSFVLPSPMA